MPRILVEILVEYKEEKDEQPEDVGDNVVNHVSSRFKVLDWATKITSQTAIPQN